MVRPRTSSFPSVTPSTSAAYLPSTSTCAAYHPSVSTSQAQYCGTSAMQSAPARGTRASALTQGGPSPARLRRSQGGSRLSLVSGGSSTIAWRAVFGGRPSVGGWRARRSRGSPVKPRHVGVGAEADGTGHRKRSSSRRQRSLAGHSSATRPRGPRGGARARGVSQRTRAGAAAHQRCLVPPGVPASSSFCRICWM